MSSIVTQLVMSSVLVVILIFLIPVLFHVVWQIMPGVAIIVLTVTILRALLTKLLQ